MIGKTTMPDFDVIIVGSGPAGVSAAFPLLDAGLRVLMVDGGKQTNTTLPNTSFLTARLEDSKQSDWMIGKHFRALHMNEPGSLKLHTPTHEHVFEGFHAAHRIVSNHFVAVGSLAVGGLSNAWGCGVAKLSQSELSDFPFNALDLELSYETVARRIGISGQQPDDLTNYFGVDAFAQPPISMDMIHHHLFKQYAKNKTSLSALNFRLGRTRVAALSEAHAGRQACDHSNHCLWGCHRGALYRATDELVALKQYDNFHYLPGFLVENIQSLASTCLIEGTHQMTQERRSISARKILLAAGTLASTGLVLRALKRFEPLSLLSCPTASFLLWLPRKLGATIKPTFSLGQLSFTLGIQDAITAFGSTLSPLGIPVAELARYLPFRRRLAIDLLQQLLSSCLIGNLFLPGNLSNSKIAIKPDGSLSIHGGYKSQVPHLMKITKQKVRKAYARLGSILLPKSFTIGLPGSDIHYAGTLPMRIHPKQGETNSLGEVDGLAGIHIIDGACIPVLTEKFPTLTIMANADRIARSISLRAM